MSYEQSQKIHFVTGKGGVGKSFFAAALAQAFTKTHKLGPGEPILLAELNDMSFYKDFLGLESIGYKPVKTPYFDVAQWKAQDCLKEYALHLLKIESLFKLFFENPISKALIDVSPGLNELAILGKATSQPRKHGPAMNYSHVVFDAYSTGHFLTMMRSPKALADTIQFGPMGEQSRSIDRWIRNKDFCEIYIICLAEELPTTETIDLYQALVTEFGLQPKVFINKYIEISENDLRDETEEIKTYFSNIMAQQKLTENKLKANGISFQKIPFVYETDAAKLLKKGSDAIAENLISEAGYV